MDKLSPDSRIYLALLMDLPELATYCLLDKNINNLTCNNEEFWYTRLKRDFDIDREEKSLYPTTEFYKEDPTQQYGRIIRATRYYGPKRYYKYIKQALSQAGDPQAALRDGALSNNLDIVKAAISKGADVNILERFNRHILYYPLTFGNLEIAEYIVNSPGFDRTQVPDIMNPGNNVNMIEIIDVPGDTFYNFPVYEYLINNKIIRPRA